MKTTTHVGSIASGNASLSVSYERGRGGAVLLHAFDPLDRRKAGIHFRLPPFEYAQLQSLFEKLNAALVQEAETRHRAELSSVSEPENGVVLVQVAGSQIGIPSAIYNQMLEVNERQDVLAAAKLLATEMHWLGESAAILVATAVASAVQAQKQRAG